MPPMTITIAEYDFQFKILLIGDSGVGKSSIILRYCDNSWTDMFISTLGVDFKTRTSDYDGLIIRLQVWDTPNWERFRAAASYYRAARVILLVFSLTDKTSWDNVRHWQTDIDRYANEDVPYVIIGNKCDLRNDRVVDYGNVREYCTACGKDYFETSAKENINIDQVFLTAVKLAMNNVLEVH